VASPGNRETRLLHGRVLLEAGRPDEALAELGFAYDGTDWTSHQALLPLFARLIHEASGGDAERAYRAVGDEFHRAWLAGAIAGSGHPEELPAWLALFADEETIEHPRLVASLALRAPTSPETDRLGRRVLEVTDDAEIAAALGGALLAGGDPDHWRQVLAEVVSRPDGGAPAAWLALGDEACRAGREYEARRLYEDGARHFPADAALARRVALACGSRGEP
jgi:hypothetical protein